MRNIALSTAAIAALGLAACGGQSDPVGPALTPGESHDSAVETIEEEPEPLQQPMPMTDETQTWPNDVPGMPDDSLLPPPVDPPPPAVDIVPPPGDEMIDEYDPALDIPEPDRPAPETEEEWPGPQ